MPSSRANLEAARRPRSAWIICYGAWHSLTLGWVMRRTCLGPVPGGFTGGGDGHSGQPGDTEASDYAGSHAFLDDAPELRLRGTIEGGVPTALLNPGGLTGVWADENTRAALFDALRRRETFRTSGVRTVPRLFGAWDFTEDDLRDLTAAGYSRGVPMGGELPARPRDAKAPTLLVHAAKDATGPTWTGSRSLNAGPTTACRSRRSTMSPSPAAGSPTPRLRSPAARGKHRRR